MLSVYQVIGYKLKDYSITAILLPVTCILCPQNIDLQANEFELPSCSQNLKEKSIGSNLDDSLVSNFENSPTPNLEESVTADIESSLNSINTTISSNLNDSISTTLSSITREKYTSEKFVISWNNNFSEYCPDPYRLSYVF